MIVSEYARQIMSLIHQDQQRPLPSGRQIPAGAGVFSALHEHCDPIHRYIVAVLGGVAEEGPRRRELRAGRRRDRRGG
jgi:hypothetical protein